MKVIVVLALVIAGLTAVDRFLAKTEAEELRAAARRSYDSGMRFMKSGQAARAVDSFRNAHALARERPEDAEYELELIAALMAAGKSAEADPLMESALARKPNDGQTNLIAARLTLREDRIPEAESYYHRAVYGEWPNEAQRRRIAARLELTHLLVEKNEHRELLAELISLEAEAAGDSAVEKRLGPLFMAAGAPSRAAIVYRALLSQDPEDAASYSGLGEAELEQGQYRAARSAFLQASYHHPVASVESRLELLNRVTALDPTPRQLPSIEKYTRALRILEMARDDLQRHVAADPGVATGETTEVIKNAAEGLANARPRLVRNEDAEHLLDLAESIWKLRLRIFGTSFSPEEDPLRLLMEKLAS